MLLQVAADSNLLVYFFKEIILSYWYNIYIKLIILFRYLFIFVI